jgi:hypothetical protein
MFPNCRPISLLPPLAVNRALIIVCLIETHGSRVLQTGLHNALATFLVFWSDCTRAIAAFSFAQSSVSQAALCSSKMHRLCLRDNNAFFRNQGKAKLAICKVKRPSYGDRKCLCSQSKSPTAKISLAPLGVSFRRNVAYSKLEFASLFYNRNSPPCCDAKGQVALV